MKKSIIISPAVIKLLEKIKALRLEAPPGWQQRCADQLGVSQVTISNIANGKTTIKSGERQIELIAALKNDILKRDEIINKALE
jgi:transcriptional regulator with XRE-family HTH domain